MATWLDSPIPNTFKSSYKSWLALTSWVILPFTECPQLIKNYAWHVGSLTLTKRLTLFHKWENEDSQYHQPAHNYLWELELEPSWSASRAGSFLLWRQVFFWILWRLPLLSTSTPSLWISWRCTFTLVTWHNYRVHTHSSEYGGITAPEPFISLTRTHVFQTKIFRVEGPAPLPE